MVRTTVRGYCSAHIPSYKKSRSQPAFAYSNGLSDDAKRALADAAKDGAHVANIKIDH